MTRTQVSLKFRAAVVGLSLLTGPAPGTPPVSGPVSGPAPESDAFLLRKVEAALATDPVLSRVPLVVSMVDGVAVIGGPVPDAGVPPRVEAVLARVPGVKVVKVTCWVPPSDDPFLPLVAARLAPAATDPAPGVRPQAPPPAYAAGLPPLAMTPAQDLAAAVARVEPIPVPVAPGQQPRPHTGPERVTTARVADPGPTAGFLLAPTAPMAVGRGTGSPLTEPTGPVEPAEPPAYQPIPAPAVPTRPVSDVRPVRDPVAAARASDPRFAGLAVRFEGRTAVISGRAADPADAWDFAAAVRAIPGVDRVVVGYVR